MYGQSNLVREVDSGRPGWADNRGRATGTVDSPCPHRSLAEQVGIEIGEALFDGKEYPDPAFTVEDLGAEVLTALRDPDPAARDQLCRAIEAVLHAEVARQALARK